jgi:hypothetical protein
MKNKISPESASKEFSFRQWLKSGDGAAWIIGVFSILLTFVTLVLVYKQLDTQIDALRITERPQVFLSNAEVLNTNFNRGTRIVVKAEFMNSGQQPTRDLDIYMGLRYTKATNLNGTKVLEVEMASGEAKLIQSHFTVAPNATISIPLSQVELIGQGGELEAGDPRYDNSWRLYIFGRLRYSLPLEDGKIVSSYFAARMMAWEQATRPDGQLFRVHNFDMPVNVEFP